MPWKTRTAMSLRRELVLMAAQPQANLAELCRRYGVSRKTAYKWIARYREGGPDALADRSCKPAHSPSRTPPGVEAAVLGVREAHPAWGGRKIRRVLLNKGVHAPSPATVTAILRRHGHLSPQPEPRRLMTRFEAEAPNELWQMDFKGDFLLGDGNRCFPLDALDDHSRFLLCLDSQLNQRRESVQASLTALFRRYGLPRRLLCDNGPPWGSGWRRVGGGRTWPRYTRLAAWLMRLGITVVHGRPYHPQTQGKLERAHRSLKEEVLAPADGGASFADLAACQLAFDRWRDVYNQERPHEALELAVPASRYVPSTRAFPTTEPVVTYDDGVTTRKVGKLGRISFRNNYYKVGKGFTGEYVGLIPCQSDGVWKIYYAHQPIWAIDLHQPITSTDL